ncbi:MAG TPA: glycosyltransferase family 2 protein [Pyrinomonadaceae bacterium]|nr:glycosyltransferase family 2 protein [Pyrinomonadaceae bacterium]
MLEQITPLILTYNEAPNIGRTLERLRWARDIVVVDSFSDDDTLEIVSRFPQARVYQRKFDSFAGQCNFGLNETGITTEWVLNLDADYELTASVVSEIANLNPTSDVIGFRAAFTYCIYGRRLRSGVYPPVTVLFRKAGAHYREDGHAHRVVLEGRLENLHSRILHDDRKPLGRWFEAQSRYTKLEANKLLSSAVKDLSWTDRIRRWRVVAPAATLVFCLIFRGGVLDGWAGFYYAFQRALAELMLSLYLIDHDLGISDFEFRHPEFEEPAPRDVEHSESIRTAQFPIRNPKSEIRNS